MLFFVLSFWTLRESASLWSHFLLVLADFDGHLFWQVHKNSKVSIAYHLLGVLGFLRQVQDLDQACRGNVFPLWKQRAKGTPWEDHGEHSQVSGCGVLQHGGRAAWFWGVSAFDKRVQKN